MYPETENAVQNLRVEQLRLFAEKEGFSFQERWGKYLELYAKRQGEREIEVLIPTSREISDYRARVFDLISSWSSEFDRSVAEIIRDLINSSYENIRFIVNEDVDENTVSFDAAIDLLQNGMKMIDASATVAMTGANTGFIQGRRPDAVRKYLDQVRVGQTEVGSFVVNLLMPVAIEPSELGLPESEFAGIGSSITRQFRGALAAAATVGRGKVDLPEEELISRGLSSNFMDAIVKIVEETDSVRVAVGRSSSSGRRRYKFSRKFDRSASKELEKISDVLRPIEVDRGSTLVGTVVSIREVPRKTSGTFIMEAELNGELKSVRGQFDRADRDKIFAALHDKADVALSVSADLVNKRGRLSLDKVKRIELEPRGGLT